ncbi:MAG: hypothetical protein J5658_09010 [Prevotella sp.]|nr:hypothetical protein [Prevotella sp.]
MSAPNFNCSHNSRHLYAFLEHSDFESYVDENKEIWGLESEDEVNNVKFYDSCIYDEWYQDEKRYYLEWLEEKLMEANKEKGLKVDFIDLDKNHVYDGDEICTVSRSFRFAGIDFDLEVSINFEAGYYEGFKLDWQYKDVLGYDTDALEYITDNDLFEALKGSYNYSWYEWRDINSPGLAKMLVPKLRKRMEKELKEITDYIDDCLEAVAPYCLEGCCASNGEGFYWPADKKAA